MADLSLRDRQTWAKRLQSKVWSGADVVADSNLPAAASLHQALCAGVLEGRDSLMDSVRPGISVSSECKPLVMIDMADV